jgi:LysM repeat protein
MRRHSLQLTSFRVAALAALCAGVPATLIAQQRDSVARAVSTAAPGAVLHVVKPGDTLYQIAGTYLGNPLRWPELFRANSSRIANANLIYPGQKLYMGADGKPTFNPEGIADAAEPEEVPTRAIPLGRPISGQSNSVLENATLNGRILRPTVRRGEVAAAPFIIAVNKPLVGGSLVARADPTILPVAMSRDQFQLFDEVNVLLPTGMRGAVGQQYGVYQYGPEVRNEKIRGRVVQPAGVIEIVAVGTGRAARARVTSMFANMQRGDVLMPLDTTLVSNTIRPQAVSNGASYDVAYIAGGVVLPTIQKYVVIALPKNANAKVGDQLSLYSEGEALTEGRRDIAPTNEVAIASVVRVSAESATAILISHEHPAIRVGMKARVVARMP